MKRTVIGAVSAVIMLAGMNCQAAEVQISMEEIVDANQMEYILQNYSSVSAEYRDFLDPQDYSSVYAAPDAFYYGYKEGQYIFADGSYRMCGLNKDGEEVLATGYNLDGTELVMPDLYPSMVGFSAADGEVISGRQDGDRLEVRIRVASDYAKETYVLSDGEYVEWEMELDAATHVLCSFKEYLFQNDGGRWLLYYTVYEYNQKAISAFDAFQTKLAQADQAAGGTRTVTVVIDPGTAEETVRTYEVCKGQDVFLNFDTAVYGEYMDEDGTVSSSDVELDYEADATFYYIKK